MTDTDRAARDDLIVHAVTAAIVFAIFGIAALTHPCPDGSALASTFSWPPLRCVVVIP